MSAPAASGKSSNLEFSISLPKKTFDMGEPVRVKMTLRNVGKKPVMVNKRLLVNDVAAPRDFRDVIFTIKTPGGGTADFAWDLQVDFPQANDFRKLKPGAAVTARDDLEDLYALELRDLEGRYTATATYVNVHPGPTVFYGDSFNYSIKGDMKAETVTIKTSQMVWFIRNAP